MATGPGPGECSEAFSDQTSSLPTYQQRLLCLQIFYKVSIAQTVQKMFISGAEQGKQVRVPTTLSHGHGRVILLMPCSACLRLQVAEARARMAIARQYGNKVRRGPAEAFRRGRRPSSDPLRRRTSSFGLAADSHAPALPAAMHSGAARMLLGRRPPPPQLPLVLLLLPVRPRLQPVRQLLRVARRWVVFERHDDDQCVLACVTSWPR